MENVPGSRLHGNHTSVASESNSTPVSREGCVTVLFLRNTESSKRRQKRKIRKEEEEEENVTIFPLVPYIHLYEFDPFQTVWKHPLEDAF